MGGISIRRWDQLDLQASIRNPVSYKDKAGLPAFFKWNGMHIVLAAGL
jgi:hypothetical protein